MAQALEPSSGETAPGSLRSCRGHDRPYDGVPTWTHAGILCTGETYKDKVKLTFAKGAALDDPAGLLNASLDGGTRRAIDLREGDEVDEAAFKALVRAAVAGNGAMAKL